MGSKKNTLVNWFWPPSRKAISCCLKKLYSLEKKQQEDRLAFHSGRRTHPRQRWKSMFTETENSFPCATQANPENLPSGYLQWKDTKTCSNFSRGGTERAEDCNLKRKGGQWTN